MESRATRRFWRLFNALPPETLREAKGAYQLFQDNAAHPITLDCRALGVLSGGHEEYDRLT